MAKCANVTRQQEVERLELLAEWLALIQCCQGAHHCRTADRHSPDGGAMLERQRPCSKPQGTTDDVEPDLGNPRAIVVVQVRGIRQMTESMLRPLRQRWRAVRIADE